MKLKDVNLEWILQESEKLGENALNMIKDHAGDIYDKVKENGSLKDYAHDVSTMIVMVIDYVKGNYKDIPYKSLLAMAFTLLYILNPFDILPDLIPVFGVVDDVVLLALCVTFVRNDIDKYRIWKEKLHMAA
jgi:uncharacterized membrane protein YkvA (DUF1232 family)